MKSLFRMILALTIAIVTPLSAWSFGAHKQFSKEQIDAADAAVQQGDQARLLKDFSHARSSYLLALHVKQSDSELYNKLGVVEIQLKQFGAAERHLQRALALDPQNVVILNNNGVVLCLKKRYSDAVQPLKEALALKESYASAHLNLAEAWGGMGFMDRAMSEYTRAIELEPDILSGTNNGVVLNFSNPEQKARVQYIFARLYAMRGNADVAIEHLQRAKDEGCKFLDSVYKDSAFTILWQDPRLARIVKRH